MKGSFESNNKYDLLVLNYHELFTNLVVIWIMTRLNAPKWCWVLIGIVMLDKVIAIFIRLICLAVKELLGWRRKHQAKRAENKEHAKVSKYLRKHGFRYVEHMPDGSSMFCCDVWVNEETGQVINPFRHTYRGSEMLSLGEIVKMVEEYNYDHAGIV